MSLKSFTGYVDENKKTSQNVHFRCGRVFINNSLKIIGISYKLQPSLLKQRMHHDEIYEDTWEDTENEWLLYHKSDVLSTSFSYARYSEDMEDLAGFGMKNSLTLPSLANKLFNSLRHENDEPIYTYNDGSMGYLVRQSVKGGSCSALHQ